MATKFGYMGTENLLAYPDLLQYHSCHDSYAIEKSSQLLPKMCVCVCGCVCVHAHMHASLSQLCRLINEGK